MAVKSLEERFWAKVNKTDNCWVWKGSTSQGYGTFILEGKIKRATHISWFLHTGEWPKNQINHKCNNTLCIRIDHVYDGTLSDNGIDTLAIGSNPMQKLTEESVIEIKNMLDGGVKIKDISEFYGVSNSTIYNITNGRNWNHITGIKRKVRELNDSIDIEDLTKRFWEKVKTDGDCYNWIAGLSNGYGQIQLGGRNKRATHVAWFLEYNEWPKNQLNHKCHNRSCVNIKHIYDGTKKENVIDDIMDCRRSSQKLSPEDVLSIKEKIINDEKIFSIAKEYNVSYSTIHSIKSGCTWQYLTNTQYYKSIKKITEQDIYDIVIRIKNSEKSIDISKIYGVSRSCIVHIKYKRNWYHITKNLW